MIRRLHRALRLSNALAAATLLATAAPALAGDLSELAGSWTKDVKLSDPGPTGANPAAELTMVVEGNEAKVDQTVHLDQGPQSFKYSYIVDGQPHPAKHPFFQGAERDITAEWKGDKLFVKWVMSNGQINVDITETWKLKGSDKVEVKRTFESPMGSSASKTVYRRQ